MSEARVVELPRLMDRLSNPRSWVAAWWPVVAVLGGAVVYLLLNLPRLGAESYWTDEQMSVGFANEGLERMLRLVAGDLHPPGYPSVLWLWIRVTGSAMEGVVRFISLLPIVIGLIVLGVVVWRRIGAGAAVVFVTLGLTSSLVASFAREARPHAPAFGLICIATAAWLLVVGTRPVRLRLVALLAVAGGLASVTQYYALLVYAIEGAVLVGWLMYGRRWREAVQVAGIGALSLVPVALWLAVSWHALTTIAPPLDLAWIEQIAGFVAEPYTSAVYPQGSEARSGLSIVSVALVVAVAGLTFGIVRMVRRDGGGAELEGSLGRGTAAFAVAVTAFGVAVVESLVLAPSLHFRSIISILPPLYVGLAAAITVPFRSFGPAAGVTAAAILVFVAWITPEPAMPPGVKDQWREAGVMIVAEVRAGLPAGRVAAVEAPWETRVDWTLTLNNAVGRVAPAPDLPAEVSGLTWIAGPEDLLAMPADQPLLFAAFHYWVPQRHESLVSTARERFGPCTDRSVSGITVLECRPSGG